MLHHLGRGCLKQWSNHSAVPDPPYPLAKSIKLSLEKSLPFLSLDGSGITSLVSVKSVPYFSNFKRATGEKCSMKKNFKNAASLFFSKKRKVLQLITYSLSFLSSRYKKFITFILPLWALSNHRDIVCWVKPTLIL